LRLFQPQCFKPFRLPPFLSPTALKSFLDEKAIQFNTLDFIENDPVVIPHQFRKKQDIEIAGFLAATLAWGQRVTIINKCRELLQSMDHAPHDFIVNHTQKDLKKFLDFKHRTFNSTDALYFISFFKDFYSRHDTLEKAFTGGMNRKSETVEPGLVYFRDLFFSLEFFPDRTKKHVATPANNSACKRINMYLRWMVRKDKQGVDFGIWKNISSAQLICPCDVHVDRVARKLGLIERKQTDWKTAVELTANLRKLDPLDPVKYDFALFGLGVDEKF